VRISGFDAAAWLRRDIAAADRPAAWVVVKAGRVRVLVAGPRRSRFVVRELAVSMPLTELDRERTGHALRTALATVIEGAPEGPGPRQRQSRTLALVAVDEPARAIPAPSADEPVPAWEVEHAHPAAAVVAQALPAARMGPMSWSGGALYEIQRVTICCGRTSTLRGPGVIVAAGWNRSPVRPELFVSGQYRQYRLPMAARGGANVAVVSGWSGHLGASVAVLPAVHLGLSVGVARLSISGEVESIEPVPPEVAGEMRPGLLVVSADRTLGLGRLFLRFGSIGLGPISLSAVALVEMAHHDLRYDGVDFGGHVTINRNGGVRPGLATEVRWR